MSSIRASVLTRASPERWPSFAMRLLDPASADSLQIWIEDGIEPTNPTIRKSLRMMRCCWIHPHDLPAVTPQDLSLYNFAGFTLNDESSEVDTCVDVNTGPPYPLMDAPLVVRFDVDTFDVNQDVAEHLHSHR